MKTKPETIDERTVDNLIRVMASQRGIPRADAARELLRGLAAWFGIDFELETNRLLDRDDES